VLHKYGKQYLTNFWKNLTVTLKNILQAQQQRCSRVIWLFPYILSNLMFYLIAKFNFWSIIFPPKRNFTE